MFLKYVITFYFQINAWINPNGKSNIFTSLPSILIKGLPLIYTYLYINNLIIHIPVLVYIIQTITSIISSPSKLFKFWSE